MFSLETLRLAGAIPVIGFTLSRIVPSESGGLNLDLGNRPTHVSSTAGEARSGIGHQSDPGQRAHYQHFPENNVQGFLASFGGGHSTVTSSTSML